jgi:GNAT superfamily N-acetyltransferase
MTKLKIIRFAKQEDAKGIAEVYKDWLEFKGILPDKLIEQESTESILNSINNPTKIYIVAEADTEEILGVCYMDLSFISLKTIRLGDMMIKSKFRRMGIGSAIINKVIEYAKNNNVIKIWLWTQEELKNAIIFYKKKGFILEGKQKNQFCNKDALLFGLIISS